MLLTLTAAFAFVRLYDTGLRQRQWPRWLVWELPLLALAIFLLVRLERGGGLATSGTSDAKHPTLAVFVFPLLLVAGVTGLALRLVRPLLRRGSGRGLPVPPYLALRRLGAARGLLVVLAVVSAVSFGAFFYAETLATSLSQTTDEKAYTANGSDVAAIVQDVRDPAAPLPVPGDEDRVRLGLGRREHLDRAAARRARRRPARAARRPALAERVGPRPDVAAAQARRRARDAAAADRDRGHARDARDLAAGNARSR